MIYKFSVTRWNGCLVDRTEGCSNNRKILHTEQLRENHSVNIHPSLCFSSWIIMSFTLGASLRADVLWVVRHAFISMNAWWTNPRGRLRGGYLGASPEGTSVTRWNGCLVDRTEGCSNNRKILHTEQLRENHSVNIHPSLCFSSWIIMSFTLGASLRADVLWVVRHAFISMNAWWTNPRGRLRGGYLGASPEGTSL